MIEGTVFQLTPLVLRQQTGRRAQAWETRACAILNEPYAVNFPLPYYIPVPAMKRPLPRLVLPLLLAVVTTLVGCRGTLGKVTDKLPASVTGVGRNIEEFVSATHRIGEEIGGGGDKVYGQSVFRYDADNIRRFCQKEGGALVTEGPRLNLSKLELKQDVECQKEGRVLWTLNSICSWRTDYERDRTGQVTDIVTTINSRYTLSRKPA